MQLARFLNTIFKKDGFILVDADSKNYIIGNIDATIICEAPKMKSYIKQMVVNIADDCMCGLNNINIKATTTEKLGFIGRSEGIAAQAICLIQAL